MCRLPAALEHECHVFLPIEAVCVLQCVSRGWRTRIGVAVRERFRWDIRYREGVDAPAHKWLDGVCKARVNVRTLHLVRTLLCMNYDGLLAFILKWLNGYRCVAPRHFML